MMILSKGNVDCFTKYQGAKLETEDLFKDFHHIKIIKKMEPRHHRRGSFGVHGMCNCMMVKVHHNIGNGKFIILSKYK